MLCFIVLLCKNLCFEQVFLGVVQFLSFTTLYASLCQFTGAVAPFGCGASPLYAVLALIVFESFSSSKHSGVIAYFNKRFIKEKIFPKELGRSINQAFDLRQEGDYREYLELTFEQVEPFIEKAKTFVQKVKEYLEKKSFCQFPCNLLK